MTQLVQACRGSQANPNAAACCAGSHELTGAAAVAAKPNEFKRIFTLAPFSLAPFSAFSEPEPLALFMADQEAGK
jgi:hypothetical protein